ncbi:metallopeptidase Oma1 (predicted) [Planoprotostelium fungivorum]|uniref:Metallopeptidase Oma1 (Predicted) n=1 Tax=Planoprotostelium fungivorum TaxID=1890364 RepID=A0A2P6NIB8_9EUKA|nr:metallopeptidase Oma1 (predicted) [Planoprotostelium fungivorum]
MTPPVQGTKRSDVGKKEKSGPQIGWQQGVLITSADDKHHHLYSDRIDMNWGSRFHRFYQSTNRSHSQSQFRRGFFNRSKPTDDRPFGGAFEDSWLRRNGFSIAKWGGGLAVLFGAYYVYHLEKVEVTGRWRMIDLSREQEIKLSEKPYQQILVQYKDKILPPNHRDVLAVKKVGKKIIDSSNIPELQQLDWEWNVIKSEEPNAFVLPGGKVCVFTGILPLMKDEVGMATVLSHEIGHIVARHTAEGLGYNKFTWFVTVFIASALHVGLLAPTVTGLALTLPFSRKREHEADVIGLVLMARACYDFKRAPEIWKRFSERPKGEVPKYFSTHPPHKDRIHMLEMSMPRAVAEAEKSHCQPKNSPPFTFY